ncbi:MAG: hypothetical protein QXE20_05140 [Acidilobaceae archaeon]
MRAHMLSECGRGLQKLLEELRILGRCSIGDGLKDSLSIALDASERTLVLMGCKEIESSEEKAEVFMVEPFDIKSESWSSLKGDLWLGLSGDVSVEGSAGALRAFVDKPFLVVSIVASSENRAYDLARKALEEICLEMKYI